MNAYKYAAVEINYHKLGVLPIFINEVVIFIMKIKVIIIFFPNSLKDNNFHIVLQQALFNVFFSFLMISILFLMIKYIIKNACPPPPPPNKNGRISTMKTKASNILNFKRVF